MFLQKFRLVKQVEKKKSNLIQFIFYCLPLFCRIEIVMTLIMKVKLIEKNPIAPKLNNIDLALQSFRKMNY